MRIRSLLAVLALNVVTFACAAQATDDSEASGNAVKENKSNKKEKEEAGTLTPEKGSSIDAGTPDAPPTITDAAPEGSTKELGPFCHALSLCCEGLRLDGYTSLAPDCEAIAKHANELDCKGASSNFREGDDVYTPPVECL
jgi:hypothetical protein